MNFHKIFLAFLSLNFSKTIFTAVSMHTIIIQFLIFKLWMKIVLGTKIFSVLKLASFFILAFHRLAF